MKPTLTSEDETGWYEARDKMNIRGCYWWTGSRLVVHPGWSAALELGQFSDFVRLVPAEANERGGE